MKTKICMAALIAALILTKALNAQALISTKPSIEGRASVAAAGVMPAGLYAKTSLFQPGDSVTVTNTTMGGVTINVLVLGPTEAGEDGIAIQLSPEAATLLFITNGSDPVVSVTKKVSAIEGGVTPAFKPSLDPDRRPEDAVPDSLREKLLAGTVPPGSAEAEKAVPPTEVPAQEKPPLFFGAKATDRVGIGEDGTFYTDPIASTYFTPPVPASQAVDTDARELAQKVDDPNSWAGARPSPPDTIFVPGPPVAVAGNAIPPPNANTDYMGRAPLPYAEPDIRVSDKGPTFYVPEVLQPYLGNPGESASVVRDPNLAMGEERPVVEQGVLNEGEKGPAVLPLPVMISEEREAELRVRPFNEALEGGGSMLTTLVTPTEPDEQVLVIKTAEPVPPERHEPRSEVRTELPRAEEPPPPPPPLPPDPILLPEWYGLVTDEGNLQRGIYVQIATMSNTRYISDLVAAYNDRYMLALVPLQRDTTSYRVMVGPLGVDEYGVVLNRFKQQPSFHDAFVKTIR